MTHQSCKIGSVYKTPFRKSDHIAVMLKISCYAKNYLLFLPKILPIISYIPKSSAIIPLLFF